MWNKIIKEYLDYIKNEKKLSQNTIDAYISDINKLYNYASVNNITNFFDINKTIIITYLLYLQRNGKSSSTISRNLASIRCLFQYLLNKNIIKEDPTLNLKSPKKEKKYPNILSEEDMEELLNKPNMKNWKGARDKAILELICGTGLRVSEIINLNIEDLDIDNSHIIINDENKIRFIPIEKNVMSSIVYYIDVYRTSSIATEPLFVNYNNTRLTRQGFWKIIKYYSILIDKEITPQTLRNSFAVNQISNGIDIFTLQEIMGHIDISTTHNYSIIANKIN
ncbi:tyrosine-type recombinase/integrase [Paratissierella segnis]|jgi:integrase/recombinase XerD|uniref:Tyrosine-type recombinase/integrase n=1 Tax=Paratissierella segnis TaxID=2763679 RepID=A0A926EVR5_9FIRM|nr:tyrosine-type recombinase/integrase [Paratissierella segnis]MBC8588407.1 tyrosine-type recombinase/integrase [Paratissierella segnis]